MDLSGLWLAMVIAGSVAWVAGVLVWHHRRPTVRLPYFAWKQVPLPTRALTGAGTATITLGAIMWGSATGSGWIAGFLIVAAYLPTVPVQLLINHHIAKKNIEPQDRPR